MKQDIAPDIQGAMGADLYGEAAPMIDSVKQVIDTLKDKVQPLTPKQMQAVGYLRYLQSRPLHARNKNKTYEGIIKHIQEDAQKVAPSGFFIRVIEALIPRPISVDSKTYEKMKKESDGQR